jgi:serine/threonine protein kinase
MDTTTQDHPGGDDGGTPPLPPDLVTPLLLGPGVEPVPGYTLVRILGRGGFGEVWEATAPGGVHVALKFVRLDRSEIALEERGLEVIRNIRHPHLVDVQFACRVADCLVIAMSLCEQNLMDRLRACQKQGQPGLPRDELLGFMADVGEALDFLNEARHPAGAGGGGSGGAAGAGAVVGIQHRDVKPHNIFVVGGSARLADFGLAKILETATASHTGAMSPHYAAPEVLEGRVTRWTDQYSLALTYFQLRTGKLPFAGESANQAIYAHAHLDPDLSGLPREERPIVARALARRPEERWPSCRELVKRLNEAGRGGPASGSRRSRQPVLAGLAAAAVLAAALFVFQRDRRQPQPQPPRPADSSVLAAILQDVRALAPADRPFVRYLSLDHLRKGGSTTLDLQRHRTALAQAISQVTLKPPEAVRPVAINPGETILRIDLRTLGWDERPFQQVVDGKRAGPSRVNLFDLVLLEYPHGIVYEPSATFEQLRREFVDPAGEVRPVVVVRADWFARMALLPPLYEDFRGLASERTMPSFAWDDATLRGDRDGGLIIPLVPLDALTVPSIVPTAGGFDVTLATSKPDNVFAPGDTMVIRVANISDKDLFIELVGTSIRGRKTILATPTTLVKSGETFRFPASGEIRIQGDLGKEQITVFASDRPFPPGVLLQGGDARYDRVVHSFDAAGFPFEPARVLKKTIEIETR